jgi:hypothetical protein
MCYLEVATRKLANVKAKPDIPNSAETSAELEVFEFALEFAVSKSVSMWTTGEMRLPVKTNDVAAMHGTNPLRRSVEWSTVTKGGQSILLTQLEKLRLLETEQRKLQVRGCASFESTSRFHTDAVLVRLQRPGAKEMTGPATVSDAGDATEGAAAAAARRRRLSVAAEEGPTYDKVGDGWCANSDGTKSITACVQTGQHVESEKKCGEACSAFELCQGFTVLDHTGSPDVDPDAPFQCFLHISSTLQCTDPWSRAEELGGKSGDDIVDEPIADVIQLPGMSQECYVKNLDPGAAFVVAEGPEVFTDAFHLFGKGVPMSHSTCGPWHSAAQLTGPVEFVFKASAGVDALTFESYELEFGFSNPDVESSTRVGTVSVPVKAVDLTTDGEMAKWTEVSVGALGLEPTDYDSQYDPNSQHLALSICAGLTVTSGPAATGNSKWLKVRVRNAAAGEGDAGVLMQTVFSPDNKDESLLVYMCSDPALLSALEPCSTPGGGTCVVEVQQGLKMTFEIQALSLEITRQGMDTNSY